MTRENRLTKFLKSATKPYEEYQRLTERSPKLSSVGCLNLSIEIANTTEARLRELDKLLTERGEQYRYTLQLLRSAMRWVKERTFTKPVSDIRRLTWLSGPNWDGLLGELGALGSSVFELMALAILKVTESTPECFGSINSMEEYNAMVSELKKELDSIYSDMEKAFTQDDLDFSPPDSKGYMLVAFKLSQRQVTFSPGWPERLVAWAVNNKNKLG